MLSRLQFAVTVFFHFIFVPLTIGLGVWIAALETAYLKTKNEKWHKLADFWGKIFAINFAFGIVTGFAMTFQFGTNWGAYSEYMGDIFASPLALEALIAFFLEGTFFGIWISVSRKRQILKTVSMWLVAVGTTISSLWIITANAFMQNPVGYTLADDGSKVLMNDFIAVLSNPYLWYMLLHTLLAAYLLTGAFIVGVSAYHLLKKSNIDLFKTSIKFGLIIMVISALLLPPLGMFYGHYIADVQPMKAAAFEAVWESGSFVPMYLIQIPGTERNIVEALGIPGLGSFMITGDFSGEVKGLLEYDEIPPVWLVFLSFRIMVILGTVFIIQSALGLFLFRKPDFGESSNSRKYLKMMLYTIPLPYIAIMLGWVVAEVGRQPWIVYGLFKTSNAVSETVPEIQVAFTLVFLTLFYMILGALDYYLLRRHIVAGLQEVKGGQ